MNIFKKLAEREKAKREKELQQFQQMLDEAFMIPDMEEMLEKQRETNRQLDQQIASSKRMLAELKGIRVV